MKKIFIWLAFYSLLCFSCVSNEEIKLYAEQSAFVYFKDPQTQLCYVLISHSYSPMFSYVPCTMEVEKMIEKYHNPLPQEYQNK